MILVDAGPLVALFDPSDAAHVKCRSIAKRLREDLITTLPVVTEVSHLLGPASSAFGKLAGVIRSGELSVDIPSISAVKRAFDLMAQYRDHPMDFADASLVALAEGREVARIWTLDRRDFASYRLLKGHRLARFEIVS